MTLQCYVKIFLSHLLSQWLRSGRCAHCTPVWFRDLSIRQHVRVRTGVARANHFSESALTPSSATGEKDAPFSSMVEGRRRLSSFSSPGHLFSLKYFLQTSWKTARQSVLSRKYHVWCSSSTKLLEAKLRLWPSVPIRSRISSSDSVHSEEEV